jgi:hypothetical protein
MASKKQTKKIGKVMREYKTGTLHSGKKGPVVKDIKQAIAIAMSEAKMKKPLGRDDVKVSRSTKGTKTVYRNPKKKNITKLPPAVKNKEYWQGV